MQQAGLEPILQLGPASEKGALEATRELLRSPNPPTAIFAGHDSLAIGALRATAEAGLEPSDLSVVGYDNVELASHPLVSLTTIDQCGREAGHTAIRLLMERINGRSEAQHECFEPTLRVRNSTASPRQA